MDTSFSKANSDNPTIKNEVNNQISVGYTERVRSTTNKLCCYNMIIKSLHNFTYEIT